MSTISPTVPSSPSAYYLSRREAGSDHDTAVAEVQHSYGRRDLGRVLEQARTQYENPPEAIEPVPEVEPVPDAFPAAEDEIRAKIAALTERRQRASPDALTDPAKRSQLAELTAELAGAEAELELIGLARLEADRLEREQAEQADRERTDAALARAAELGTEAAKVWQKVEKIAATFAQALADHNRLQHEQAQALSAAGRTGAWGTSPQAVTRLLADSLRAARAPMDWLTP